LHEALEQFTQEPWRIRPWVLRLRSVCAGFPLFGILTVPAWRSLQENSPSWAMRREPPPASLTLSCQSQSRRPLRRPGAVVMFSSLMISGPLWCAVVDVWMMRRTLQNPALRTETLFLSVPLRLALFACQLAYLRSAHAHQNTSSSRLYRLALAASLFWLIPVPYVSLAGVLPLVAFGCSMNRSGTLVW